MIFRKIFNSIREFITENRLATNLSEGVMFNDSFMCGGYENTSSEQLEMIKRIASSTGVILDSTYTGKAWYGMEQYVKNGTVKPGSNVPLIIIIFEIHSLA